MRVGAGGSTGAGGGGGVEVLGPNVDGAGGGRENGDEVIATMDGVEGAERGSGTLAGIVNPRGNVVDPGATTGGSGAAGTGAKENPDGTFAEVAVVDERGELARGAAEVYPKNVGFAGPAPGACPNPPSDGLAAGAVVGGGDETGSGGGVGASEGVAIPNGFFVLKANGEETVGVEACLKLKAATEGVAAAEGEAAGVVEEAESTERAESSRARSGLLLLSTRCTAAFSPTD